MIEPVALGDERLIINPGGVGQPLLDRQSALGTLALLETRYCLVGHSHVPFVCREVEGKPIQT